MTIRTFNPNVHDLHEIQRALKNIQIQVPIADYDGTVAPGIADDITKGWRVGSKIIFNNTIYECSNNTENAAVWQQMIGTNPVAGGVAGQVALDPAVDYTGIFDVSEGTNKRVTLQDFVKSASGDHNHTSAAGDGGVLTNDLHDGYVEIAAIPTPANPPTNSWRFFSRINGSNLELVCRAPLGGECILCTQANATAHVNTLPLNWIEP